MCKRLICLLLGGLVLGFVLTSAARADLVGWWKFDDGSGTVATDSTGNGNDGVFNGNPQWVAGKLGGALEFDGSGDWLDCGSGPSLSLSDAVTMMGWIRLNVATADQKVGGNQDGASGGYKMTVFTNSKVEFEIRTAANAATLNRNTAGGTVLTTGEWYHVAGVYSHQDGYIRTYVNGVLDRELATTDAMGASPGPFRIGCEPFNTGSYNFNGVIDDLRVYSTALTADEIQTAMQGTKGYPYALSPDPADGALHADTWVTLSWKPGDFAVSHDVYLGDNFDDVNAATPDSNTFRGNQTSTYYVAGFPGFAYPDGLVPGTTYYWRIDEVNEAEPNSPWKGKVWSFTVPPKKAYDPQPADGAKFIDPAATTLSWTAGFGAKLHTVYFGDDLDTVTNATGGAPQALTTYSPGALEADKTYYWRIDEFDAVNTYKGDVWSFTTAKVGGGVKGQYFKGMNFETFVLSRIDPQINFNWGDPGGPDPAVGVDNFSARWTGEVEAAFTETYTFYTNSDDGVRLWINGQQLVDNWTDHGATENSGKIDLVAGNSYSLQMEYYENGGGAVAELRWSSPHTPKQLIPQAALSPPVKASAPKPGNGATGASLTPVLTWNAGDFAASHDVYFGTDADAVRNATKTSPEYKGSKALGDESYSPGKLDWFTTYYWRVDEVNDANPDSPWIGNLWSFTTGDFLLIDDFESYDDGDNQIWYSWHDGLGYGAPGTADYFAGNGTGSAVGDETTASYTEETIVHGGRQSMPLSYDNNKQGFAKYSETEFKLTYPRDWTEEGVGELSLWFRGRAASVGSFVESPAGTYTMTATGADIWGTADQFHFAYKTLTGAGSIVAKVQSVTNTNGWAKAGVMIRETLDPGSKHAFACVTPSNGVAFQGRDTADAASFSTNQTGVTAPYWVKLERDAAGNFTVSHSADGVSWQPVTNATPHSIPMSSMVYVGLALTSHDATKTCQAVFSNVTITGTVGPQWADQDIGIASNAPEPLYVAVSNATGQPAMVTNPDPNAATTTTWTQWVIPLSEFSDQGINLTNVDTLAIGLGTRGNMTVPGGSGEMYFDDIRLYRPTTP
jgi:Concanavalin A-like lectin/glucanases superfamily/PA14 domain